MSNTEFMSGVRLASTFVAICFVAACSVADYRKPIHDLSDAINDSVTTVESIDREITKVQNERWRALITSGQALLQDAEDECAAGAKACSLVIRIAGNDKPFPARSVMPNALVGLSGLTAYVSSLKAIVDADTAAAVTTSANEALASAAEIESAIAKANNKPGESGTIKAYSGPSLAAVKWLVSQYVERVKYRALKSATNRAQPAIESLATFHQTAGAAAAALKESAALNAFIAAQKEYDAEPKSDAVINAYADAAETFNDTLKGAAAQPLARFLEAHTKLNDSLNGDGPASLVDAIAAIKDFKQRVEEFKKIIVDFNRVASSHVEG